MSEGTVIVKYPSITACTSTKVMWTSPNLANSSFKYSTYGNVLASVGCQGYALLYNETGGIIKGCTSVCTLNPPAAVLRGSSRCYGYQCCMAQLPTREFKQYSISVLSNNNTSGLCRSAFFFLFFK